MTFEVTSGKRRGDGASERGSHGHVSPSASGLPHLPPPVLVDTPGAFDSMMAVLSLEPALALDTESNSLYRYHYRVCMIQISTAYD